MTSGWIPTSPNPYTRFTIVLDRAAWAIDQHWNQMAGVWILGLSGIDYPEIIKNGIVAVGGVDLLRRYAIVQLGSLYLFDAQGADTDPTFESFGTRHRLFYADKDLVSTL